MRKVILAAVLLALPQAAFAWGYVGHKTIGEVATKHFPAELPAFLRGPEAAARIGLLSQEPDTTRNAGQPHDWDLDPGHFLDVSDDMTILGGPRLSALPPSRRDYDTALRAVGFDQYKAGFLPYNILDGYQQLVKDFALLRAYQASVKNAAKFKLDAAGRRDLARLLSLRQMLTLRDLGYWAHFVEDASQPMHVSVHYNGWATAPTRRASRCCRASIPSLNPISSTPTSPRPMSKPACGPISIAKPRCRPASRITSPPSRRWWPRPMNWTRAARWTCPRRMRRTLSPPRLADGASRLRDMVTDAWRESAKAELGYKVKTPVADYESGKAIMILQSRD